MTLKKSFCFFCIQFIFQSRLQSTTFILFNDEGFFQLGIFDISIEDITQHPNQSYPSEGE